MRCCYSKNTLCVHKHKHADHSSTGVCSSGKLDSCCQEKEGSANSMTAGHKQCGAVDCSDGACNKHEHKHAHEDHCSMKESYGSEDRQCCQEAGRHEASTTGHKPEVATGCRVQICDQDVHDWSKAECHVETERHETHVLSAVKGNMSTFKCGTGPHTYVSGSRQSGCVDCCARQMQLEHSCRNRKPTTRGFC